MTNISQQEQIMRREEKIAFLGKLLLNGEVEVEHDKVLSPLRFRTVMFHFLIVFEQLWTDHNLHANGDMNHRIFKSRVEVRCREIRRILSSLRRIPFLFFRFVT